MNDLNQVTLGQLIDDEIFYTNDSSLKIFLRFLQVNDSSLCHENFKKCRADGDVKKVPRIK